MAAERAARRRPHESDVHPLVFRCDTDTSWSLAETVPLRAVRGACCSTAVRPPRRGRSTTAYHSTHLPTSSARTRALPRCTRSDESWPAIDGAILTGQAGLMGAVDACWSSDLALLFLDAHHIQEQDEGRLQKRMSVLVSRAGRLTHHRYDSPAPERARAALSALNAVTRPALPVAPT